MSQANQHGATSPDTTCLLLPLRFHCRPVKINNFSLFIVQKKPLVIASRNEESVLLEWTLTHINNVGFYYLSYIFITLLGNLRPGEIVCFSWFCCDDGLRLCCYSTTAQWETWTYKGEQPCMMLVRLTQVSFMYFCRISRASCHDIKCYWLLYHVLLLICTLWVLCISLYQVLRHNTFVQPFL